MSKIVFVSGLDEMSFAEQMAQGFAGANVLRWQRELKKGDCFVYFADGLAVYSEVLADDTSDFRFTRSYSVACDTGELGDVHLSVIFKRISRQQFETFKANDWPAQEDVVRATLLSN